MEIFHVLATVLIVSVLAKAIWDLTGNVIEDTPRYKKVKEESAEELEDVADLSVETGTD